MSSYSTLGRALEGCDPVPAEDYVWDCQELFYWGAAVALLIGAKESAGGEIQDLSPIVERLVSVISSRNSSVRERKKVARTLLRRMKPEDPDIYPRHEYAFLARELLRVAFEQIKQR